MPWGLDTNDYARDMLDLLKIIKELTRRIEELEDKINH